MADEYAGKASFLHGLSDLWLRFFKDKDMLQAIYRGTEILIGQAYLDLVSEVLNTSMREVPVFNKEFFKLLLIREDGVVFDEGANPDANRNVFEMLDALTNVQMLQNKVFDPCGISLSRASTSAIRSTRSRIVFTVRSGAVRSRRVRLSGSRLDFV